MPNANAWRNAQPSNQAQSFFFSFCAQKVAAEEPEEGERFLVLNVLNYDAIIEAGHVIEEFKYRT